MTKIKNEEVVNVNEVNENTDAPKTEKAINKGEKKKNVNLELTEKEINGVAYFVKRMLSGEEIILTKEDLINLNK
jgi:hypothetical protein